MTAKELFELFTDTYKKTLEDNKEDFSRVCVMLGNLCFVLKVKGILTDAEIKMILDFENRLPKGGKK